MSSTPKTTLFVGFICLEITQQCILSGWMDGCKCKNYYHLRVLLTEVKVLGSGDLLFAHYSERQEL